MINKELKVGAAVEINATAEQVWDALTNPEKIATYLFGTKTTTDWKVGSPITFQGEFKDVRYKDKGNVLENIERRLLKYNYWSGFSGLEDKLENYSEITYDIEQLKNGNTKLTWIQVGFATEEAKGHSESGLVALLDQIKKVAES
jgi:uncharacterized protein YndB with AHSA1/START domain